MKINKKEQYDSTVLKAQNDIEELLSMSTHDSDYRLYFKVFPGQEPDDSDSENISVA